MRYILILLYFFSLSYVNAQSANFDPNIVINSSIDTTSVKIGEEIIYTIDVISKNKYNIRFDEKPNFIPFEILDSHPYDSIIDSSKISKKYIKIKTKIVSHLKIDVPVYSPKKLPETLKSIPITTPGSRFIK